MSRGSELPTWAWADDKRHCDTCGDKLRISDVALFYGIAERFIRCFECVDARSAEFVARTRENMGTQSKEEAA